MEFYNHFDHAQAHHAPKMGRKIDRAVPREERTIETPDRHAIKPCVSERDRLNNDGRNIVPLCGAKQRAFEREDAVAVSACSFWK
jgi:hypothetical protein